MLFSNTENISHHKNNDYHISLSDRPIILIFITDIRWYHTDILAFYILENLLIDYRDYGDSKKILNRKLHMDFGFKICG